MNADKTNYDLLYNPRLLVKNYQEIFDRWGEQSERARASLGCYLDVPYGPSEAEKMDVFRAQGKSRGLLMYIHGGYWRSLDKKRFSFVVPALARAGITVAVPDYALCPAVQVPGLRVAVPQRRKFRRAGQSTPPLRAFRRGASGGDDALLPLAGLLAGPAEEGRRRRDVYQRLVRPGGDRQGTLGEL